VAHECNPESETVPLLAYNLYKSLSRLADVTLVTHERNRAALEKSRKGEEIGYMRESPLLSRYYVLMSRFFKADGYINNWFVFHAAYQAIHRGFDKEVERHFAGRVRSGEYDVVHAITPMIPRYPYRISKACQKTPFILGPVNGGLPYPKGFREIGKREFSELGFLRELTRFIPGYMDTYRRADKVLAGSTHTLNFLKETHHLSGGRIELFFENGVEKDFFHTREDNKGGAGGVNILFVGRLVPYKCADMVVEAFSRLEPDVLSKSSLTIVGDGPERHSLEAQASRQGIAGKVRFTGWVEHGKITAHYRKADIFCFPSVREFGGAVVLEAMANGLPCIVVRHGGIGDYVTPGAGYSIEPISREQVIEELREKISMLAEDGGLRKRISENAYEEAKKHEWGKKAENLIRIYEEAIKNKDENRLHGV